MYHDLSYLNDLVALPFVKLKGEESFLFGVGILQYIIIWSSSRTFVLEHLCSIHVIRDAQRRV